MVKFNFHSHTKEILELELQIRHCINNKIFKSKKKQNAFQKPDATTFERQAKKSAEIKFRWYNEEQTSDRKKTMED